MTCSNFSRFVVCSAAGDQSANGSENNATGSHVVEDQLPAVRDCVQFLRVGDDGHRSWRRHRHHRVHSVDRQ